jgi:23S rRNA (uracil1939-C5)-methyltransferase
MHTIITDKIVSGGDCIGKINGKTIFVSGALPGEKVEIEITNHKKNYDKSHVVKVIEPSEHRIVPPCPLYGICGGCNLQIADTNYQQQLRKEIMQDIFIHAFYHSQIQLPEIETVSGSSTEYRNRFQFDSGGLKKHASTENVKLTDCLVAVPEIRTFLASEKGQKIIKNGRTYVFADKRVQGTEKVVFAPASNTLCSVLLTVPTSTNNVTEHTISFDVQGFFQSNLQLVEKTIPFLIEGLEGDHLLDMYAGVGTFSVFAGKKFKQVTLVEHNKNAISFAKINLQHLITAGIKINSIATSGEKWIESSNIPSFDAVIIDPPRSGIEKPVLNWLCSSKTKKIRYLSCDPVTLARDTKKLIESGYTLQRLFMLDFYPQTSHIESLAWFENEKI